ncbi:MAG: hypothetical protein E7438_04170 [Ruminococcaceae bacterium]|nr:hypothetical protein [Oscillospiraceae bacterium]
MDARKFVLKETGIVALGQALCAGLMIGIFALLGKWDTSIWLGGLIGGILATANFFFMAIAASVASEKAVNQDVKGGQLTMRLSYFLRLAVIFVILYALVKSGVCHVLTGVLPLLFTRPILFVAEFFRKSGEIKA